jgi:hypothetical protein
MKFGNEFWLILIWEYIIPKLFAVRMLGYENEHSGAALHGEHGQEGRGGFVPG